ncbi:MAG: glucose-6-phosphate dehydrogenase [Erysipelotrichaceae bacterium]|nr:glucose-6-phosphate dehydrogenase [Erysipelotrichaceae bacterium]
MIKDRFIIFGATGDLAYRKLLPAFYNMVYKGLLTEKDQIIVVGRRSLTTSDYIDTIIPWIKSYARFEFNDQKFLELSKLVHYCRMDITISSDYDKLRQTLSNDQATNTIVYLAIAPSLFKVATDGLAQIGQKQIKIVMEKPFGDTLEQAKRLNQQLKQEFGEDRLYLIDHYLGKEMVRNILTIRCANPIFERLWNHEAIEKIEISAMETVGVENRAGYYDQTGALKDMVQNHLLQILTIVALDDPANMDSFKDQQLAILNALYYKGIDQQNMVLGQYESYQKEPEVKPGSNTETFAALKLYIDKERWKNVPFIISTAKKADHRSTEVKVTFKQKDDSLTKNVLVIKIQPEEGVEMHFNIKTPGKDNGIMDAKLDFCQSCSDTNRINTPEAYEWMLEAIAKGDQFWFSEWNQIQTSWILIDKMRQEYHQKGLPIFRYPPASDMSEYLKELS